MKKIKGNNVVKNPHLFLLLIFLSLSFLVMSQASQSITDLPGVSTKVGAALPSTGLAQFPPLISHVAAVAPDVLCIEIDACKIIPRIQIPYIADPEDVIVEGSKTALGEIRNMHVVRDGFPLGNLVGEGRKTITLHDRLVGKHLNTDVADKATSYTISSRGDDNYKEALSPVKVWRKTKPTDWTDTSWQFEQTQLGTAKHYIYLKLPKPLKEGDTYLINLPGLDLNRSFVYYVHDPVYTRSEAVHVSQIGFRADDPEKNAYLSVWMGNGGGYTYPEN
ncbi:MAG: hypothetical protein HQ541_10900, partial [Mariniphaga sp.]|nr:hypothetical protein [Mariniphaga sp.]